MVQVIVGVAPIVVSPRDSRVVSITFFNDSPAAQVISISKQGAVGLAAVNREYTLLPGAGLAFDMETDGSDIRGEWGAYATAAGGVLVIGVCSDRGR
jgi:hypothetical protein